LASAITSLFLVELIARAKKYGLKTDTSVKLKIDALETSQSELIKRAQHSYSLYKKKFTVTKMVDTLETIIRRFIH